MPRVGDRFDIAPGALVAAVPSVLDPVSDDAERIGRLWWVMLAIASVVFVVVLWLIIGSIVRSRRVDDEPDGVFGRRLVLWGGLVVPAMILIGVFALSSIDLQALAKGEDADLEIVVTGEQWWWRVEYPDSGAVTANEIHVPAGEKVRFVLETDDVIHSFWVPQAGPKRDMIPGRANQLTLSFDRPGTYRGVCSEFCGLQHAKMQFLVVAEARDDFDAWIARQRSVAAEPSGELARSGQEVFVSNACVGCHTIRGVAEAGDRGPDLTHLASRSTIGGATLDLTTGHLRAFVRNPSVAKPGVLMPPSEMSNADLDDLVTYLESLR